MQAIRPREVLVVNLPIETWNIIKIGSSLVCMSAIHQLLVVLYLVSRDYIGRALVVQRSPVYLLVSFHGIGVSPDVVTRHSVVVLVNRNSFA